MAREDPDGLRAAFDRLAGGDAGALAEIYDACSKDLYGFALWKSQRPHIAEDAVQNVFVRLATSGPRLANVRRPRAYLLRMVSHACVDEGRREARHSEVALDLDLVESTAPDPESRLEAERASRRLATLPTKQREALYLRFFADLSYREIGRISRVSTFTAASRCRLGLRRLRNLIGADNDE